MTFAEIFDTAPIGAIVTVSNGLPKPPEGPSLRWRLWRSENFSGPLLEKIEADGARKLKIEAHSADGVSVAYEVAEGIGHTFELAA